MREFIWFWVGFTTRAMIAYVSDLRWRWWLHRMYVEHREETAIMRWKVQFWDIQWAGAKVGGELPGHPRDLELIVFADSEETAINYALKKTSDDYGTQIVSVGITEADILPEPHRDDLND